ncbi:reverse transcriptase family protein [Algibacter lectus]|uniref:RNA-directed DNA polymerase n=2 Tax=Algibacter lectus TaxID=221126 RepID=A0A4R8M3R8_9FLAO|nr:reverse transcriptase family protein [Algibacter lectus]MWW26434.1 RNA-directed DNA polymerase [Algibacter lectus]TDY59873.1 RNA-directed DNA polymerase [Algibacter lectus]
MRNNSTERRQEIYDKIKASSKQEYILSEMKRLGFWNEGELDFKAVNTFFNEERELSQKLQKLLKEKKVIEDPEAFLAKKHQERKLASKQSQKATKERREKERLEKTERWRVSKEKDIIYLGENYSHQLNEQISNTERLKSKNLPVLHTAEDLAKAMNISIGELRFLSFSRKNSKISHYKRFQMAKKSGGYRLISAPMPKLKKAQHWVLESVLNIVSVHSNAHGCVIGRSIKTNAEPHVGKAVVINQDFKNFFPSVTYARIKGVFLALGYSNQVATIFSLLCSEPKILDVSLLGEDYYAQRGERFLPQGAPTSPAITNILCEKLDFRLTGLANKYGFTYTRYVDDITFSGTHDSFDKITPLLKYSRYVVNSENFNLHPEKLRIMKRNAKQEVTGVVVNEKTNIPKGDLKRFRALLFQIEKDGIEGKYWTKGGNVLAQIDGYANYIFQIEPEKGVLYKKRVNVILEKYNYKEKHKATYVPKVLDKREKANKPDSVGGIFNKIMSFFRK